MELLLALLLAAPASHRATAARAEALGHMQEAAREYEAAWVDERAPDLLYRLGLVQRKLKRYALAREAFLAYLRDAPDGGLRDEVERQLAKLEVLIEAQSEDYADPVPKPARRAAIAPAAPPPAQPSPPAAAQPSPPAAPAAATPAAGAAFASVPVAASAPAHSTVAPWLLGGAAATAVAGGWFWSDSSRLSRDLDARFASGDLPAADRPSYARAHGESVAGRLPLGADVPLSLAPAGGEGAVPFSVELRDDPGRVAALPGAVLADDHAPRIFVDPASVPSSAVLRGVPVSLRVTVEDLSPVAVAGATRSADGSFALPVDTRAAPPGASTMEVAIVATDAVGNASTAHAAIPLTRLKFVAQHPAHSSVTSLVLNDNLIWALIDQSGFWLVRRSDGASLLRPPTGGNAFAQLATDGSRLFFSRSDNRLCRMGADGVIQLCQATNATLTSGPILQGTTAIVATTGTATASSRLIGMPDDASGALIFSDALGDFASNTPAIGPDGIVYAGASQAVATARSNALNWTTGRATAASSHYRGQPAFRGNQVLLATTAATLDAFSFIDPLGSPAPSPTTTQVATLGVTLSSPTIAADGTAIFATGDRHLVALRPDNSIRWTVALSDQATAPPTNGDGDLVYVGTVGGDILALNLADGTTAWKYAAGSPIRGPLAPGCDGILYAATDGAVIALVIDAAGLANSPWPMASHDVRGSGDARRPLRSTVGACLE